MQRAAAKMRMVARRLGAEGLRAEGLRAGGLRAEGFHGVGIRTMASSAPATGGEIVPFNLADIGEGITEVEVLKWFIKEGDHIKAFDPICEVQSDKATVEISSRYDGEVVRIHHLVGGMANVGQPLIDIRREGSAAKPTAPQTPPAEPPVKSAAATPPKPASPAPSAAQVPLSANGSTPVAAKALGSNKVLATPAVRAIAKNYGIDIASIPGSGREGRVMKDDILEFLKDQKFGTLSLDPPTTGPVENLSAKANGAPLPTPTAPPGRSAVAEEDQVEPVRGFMRTMIKTMQLQVQVPHFGYSDEYDMDGVIAMRKLLKADAEKGGVKLTYMPIIIKALSLSISQHKEVNSKFTDDMQNVRYVASHNIGIAVDTPTGLVVPNIKGVQNLSVFEIAGELERLSSLAREGKLAKEDLEGGTITLSNVGAIGGTYTSPILMPGEALIGAMGSIEKIPKFDDNGQVVAKSVMRMSWSGDHRLLAGAQLARFSNTFKDLLASPTKMLLNLR